MFDNMRRIMPLIAQCGEEMERIIRKVFSDFDTNGTGYQEKGELKLLCNLIADKLNVERPDDWQIDYISSIIDDDKDGKIEVNEMIQNYRYITKELNSNKKKKKAQKDFLSEVANVDSNNKQDHYMENLGNITKQFCMQQKREQDKLKNKNSSTKPEDDIAEQLCFYIKFSKEQAQTLVPVNKMLNEKKDTIGEVRSANSVTDSENNNLSQRSHNGFKHDIATSTTELGTFLPNDNLQVTNYNNQVETSPEKSPKRSLLQIESLEKKADFSQSKHSLDISPFNKPSNNITAHYNYDPDIQSLKEMRDPENPFSDRKSFDMVCPNKVTINKGLRPFNSTTGYGTRLDQGKHGKINLKGKKRSIFRDANFKIDDLNTIQDPVGFTVDAKIYKLMTDIKNYNSRNNYEQRKEYFEQMKFQNIKNIMYAAKNFKTEQLGCVNKIDKFLKSTLQFLEVKDQCATLDKSTFDIFFNENNEGKEVLTQDYLPELRKTIEELKFGFEDNKLSKKIKAKLNWVSKTDVNNTLRYKSFYPNLTGTNSIHTMHNIEKKDNLMKNSHLTTDQCKKDKSFDDKDKLFEYENKSQLSYTKKQIALKNVIQSRKLEADEFVHKVENYKHLSSSMVQVNNQNLLGGKFNRSMTQDKLYNVQWNFKTVDERTKKMQNKSIDKERLFRKTAQVMSTNYNLVGKFSKTLEGSEFSKLVISNEPPLNYRESIRNLMHHGQRIKNHNSLKIFHTTNFNTNIITKMNEVKISPKKLKTRSPK